MAFLIESTVHMQNTRIYQLCQALLYREDTDVDFGAGNVFSVFTVFAMSTTVYWCSGTLLSYSLRQGCSIVLADFIRNPAGVRHFQICQTDAEVKHAHAAQLNKHQARKIASTTA